LSAAERITRITGRLPAAHLGNGVLLLSAVGRSLPVTALAATWRKQGVRHFLLFVTVPCLTVSWVGSSFSEHPTPVTKPVAANPIRVAAEWEPVTGVLIGWPLQLPPALVCALSQQVDLYVTVCDCRAAEQAAAQFGAWGIDPKRVRFVVTEQGTGYYLTRDWGPFAAFDEEGRYRLVDSQLLDYPFGTVSQRRLFWMPRITRVDYRPDDRAPLAVAQTLGCPSRELPFAMTGGNVAFDGQGTAFATEIMLDENRAYGVSRETLLAIAQQELGVQHFHFVPNFQRFGIQHIDCLMKLLDEERILIKRAPPDHPAFEHIERAVCHLSRLSNVYGRPYQLLRIDTPRYYRNKLANYTNALIVNRTIFVPLFGIPADAMALSTWRQAMPGYEVYGFEHKDGLKSWSTSDALHCRVRGIWDPGMLYLAHRRMDAVVDWASQFTLAAHVRDYSGAGLIEEQLSLVWRTGESTPWRKVRLQGTAQEHVYQGTIEGVPPEQTVEYYFAAASRSGRQETLPRTAPDGFYTFATAQLPSSSTRRNTAPSNVGTVQPP
jgi:agmatine deiminase